MRGLEGGGVLDEGAVHGGGQRVLGEVVERLAAVLRLHLVVGVRHLLLRGSALLEVAVDEGDVAPGLRVGDGGDVRVEEDDGAIAALPSP
jgi:hypothetical protein